MIIRIFTFCLLILFCAIGIISLQSVDKEQVYNMSVNAIHSSFSNASQNFKINPNDISIEGIIIGIVYKLADTMIYVFEKLSVLMMRLAIENPQINFKLLYSLLLFALFFFIAIPLIKLLIIMFILIKDFIQSRREKREIEQLKRRIQ